MYFLRDFELFELLQNNEDSNSLQIDVSNDLKIFLNWPEYQQWKSFVKFHEEPLIFNQNITNLLNTTKENNKTILDSFFFTVAYYGEDLKDWFVF